MGRVLFRLSFITVLAQGNSSQAVRKLKMDTEAIPGFAKGNTIRKNTVNTPPPSIYMASSSSFGTFSTKPLIIKVEYGMTQAT